MILFMYRLCSEIHRYNVFRIGFLARKACTASGTGIMCKLCRYLFECDDKKEATVVFFFSFYVNWKEISCSE